MASPMNAINLLAYCSGSAVEIPSTLDPYLTVFAALAVIFLTPAMREVLLTTVSGSDVVQRSTKVHPGSDSGTRTVVTEAFYGLGVRLVCALCTASTDTLH